MARTDLARTGRARTDRARTDRGSVTAEAALALPALCLVLGAVLFVVMTGVAQLRCVDAARAGARVAARGEAVAVVQAAARDLAPAGARVAVAGEDGVVRVRVEAALRAPGILRRLGTVRLAADAVAAVEEQDAVAVTAAVRQRE
ncbi:hypothetical protein G9H71_18430 [Motilibacter sp. E257]|uniref:TadE-like domain-containing protein n=1 Tax=Motilibacter deserti TaxID=2714956 RepID=A0ABX0GXQ1_9ACTN|nr:hypothetical protein [Motilibacter deserti]